MSVSLSKISYLNDAKNLSQIATQDINGIWRINITIGGIHCMSCISTIETNIKRINGIVSIDIHIASNQANVVWDNKKIRFTEWIKNIESLGFKVQLTESKTSFFDIQEEKKRLFWYWLVALLCSLQIMMFSMPSYLSGLMGIDNSLKKLFELSSLILIIPVLIFPGRIFFHNAFNAIKNLSINMDVPICLGIILMFFFSMLSMLDHQTLSNGKVYHDSMSMLIFFLTSSRYIETKIRHKSWQDFHSIFNKIPKYARKILHYGKSQIYEKLINPHSLKINDIIKVLPGEEIPIDGVIIEGSCFINQAFISGESFPVKKNMGDYVLGGSYNNDGVIFLKVSKPFSKSGINLIHQLMYDAQKTKPYLVKIADKIAKPFLFAIILLAFLSYFFWASVDRESAINALISVLIVTCPCALYLSSPLVMISASNVLAKKGIFSMNLSALETLASSNYVIFDKTGTLTYGQPAIKNIKLNNNVNKREILSILKSIAKNSMHPFSKQIAKEFDESFNVKLTNLKEHIGLGLSADSKKYKNLRFGSSSFCNLDKSGVFDLKGQVHLVSEDKWLASIIMDDKPRNYASTLINYLRLVGMKIVIYSGDIKENVTHLARQLKIKDFFWEVSPEEKLKKIQNLQMTNNNVLMIGDGLNDGPALTQSNVSIAMGLAPSVVQSKSDFIIINNNLSLIKTVIQLSKKVIRVIKQNMVWAVLYNLIMIPFALMGMIEPWIAGLGMSLSSLVVVLNSYRINL